MRWSPAFRTCRPELFVSHTKLALGYLILRTRAMPFAVYGDLSLSARIQSRSDTAQVNDAGGPDRFNDWNGISREMRCIPGLGNGGPVKLHARDRVVAELRALRLAARQCGLRALGDSLRSFSARVACRCSIKGSASTPSSATTNGTHRGIKL